MFHVGQKVVCVDDGNYGLPGRPSITKGTIYDIRCMRIDHTGRLVLGLVGVFLQWDAARFRPIVERKTDISVFTAMLSPAKHEVDI